MPSRPRPTAAPYTHLGETGAEAGEQRFTEATGDGGAVGVGRDGGEAYAEEEYGDGFYGEEVPGDVDDRPGAVIDVEELNGRAYIGDHEDNMVWDEPYREAAWDERGEKGADSAENYVGDDDTAVFADAGRDEVPLAPWMSTEDKDHTSDGGEAEEAAAVFMKPRAKMVPRSKPVSKAKAKTKAKAAVSKSNDAVSSQSRSPPSRPAPPPPPPPTRRVEGPLCATPRLLERQEQPHESGRPPPPVAPPASKARSERSERPPPPWARPDRQSGVRDRDFPRGGRGVSAGVGHTRIPTAHKAEAARSDAVHRRGYADAACGGDDSDDDFVSVRRADRPSSNSDVREMENKAKGTSAEPGVGNVWNLLGGIR